MAAAGGCVGSLKTHRWEKKVKSPETCLGWKGCWLSGRIQESRSGFHCPVSPDPGSACLAAARRSQVSFLQETEKLFMKGSLLLNISS